MRRRKKTLLRMTQDYWVVSNALRLPGSAENVTTEYAMGTLGWNTAHLSEERKLAWVTHELKFDIIEGSTRWRDDQDQIERDKHEHGIILQLIRSTRW